MKKTRNYYGGSNRGSLYRMVKEQVTQDLRELDNLENLRMDRDLLCRPREGQEPTEENRAAVDRPDNGTPVTTSLNDHSVPRKR